MFRATHLFFSTTLAVIACVGWAGGARAASSSVVISQVYGGGGNADATFTHDYIELQNRGTTAVSLAGWSVQYASASGTVYIVTPLAGSIAPGQYYLVQQAPGAGGTTPLPTPDAIGSTAMSGTSAKVALVTNTTALGGADVDAAPGVLDFVGYGLANDFEGAAAASVLSNTTALFRGPGADTDDNAVDFSTGDPSPRNSVPEPAGLSLLALAGTMLLRRRR